MQFNIFLSRNLMIKTLQDVFDLGSFLNNLFLIKIRCHSALETDIDSCDIKSIFNNYKCCQFFFYWNEK